LLALRGSYRIAKNYSNKVDGPIYNTGFDEKNASALIGYNSRSGYSHLNFTLYDNLQGIPDGSRDSLSRKFTKQVLEGAADDIINRPVVSAAELHSYTLSPLHQHIQHYRMYSNNHYKLNAGDVDISLGLQQNIRREYSHPTAPDQAGLFVRLNTVNYGIKYIAPLLYDIEISAGINGMYQNNKSRNATDFPIPDYHLFDAGAYTYAKWKKR
jgi:iron complex outermembrane receptor protein